MKHIQQYQNFNNPIKSVNEELLPFHTVTKVIPISFEIDWNDKIGKVETSITLAMSDSSLGIYEIGDDIEKYTGVKQADVEKDIEGETPTDAIIYGMVNGMNGGKDQYFWTNGTRLAGAASKVGVWPACFDLVGHECIHVARSILTRHIFENSGEEGNWINSDWPSIGEQENDILGEEDLTTATGAVIEQVTDAWLEMAEYYIPALTLQIRDLK